MIQKSVQSPSGGHDDARAEADAPVVVTQIELPFRTIFRVLLIIGTLWLFERLWSIVLLLIIASFLAIALNPAVHALQRRGASRGAAVGLVSIAVLGAVVGLGLLTVPTLIDQGQQLAEDLPEYTERMQQHIRTNETIRNWIQNNADRGQADPTTLFTGALSYGARFASGIANLVLVMALTIYLLLDGPRLYRWFLEVVPTRQRRKLERVRPEVGRVVGGYVRGQILTSLLFGIFTYVVLTVAGVPLALLLAVLAAFLDAVPLIGATAATIPAVLLAATVSIPTAIVVLVLYVAYQQVENYVITPRVYGKTLEISSLAALVAVLIGATLLGIIGVLLALPIAAALPTIVTVWRDDLQTVVAGPDES